MSERPADDGDGRGVGDALVLGCPRCCAQGRYARLGEHGLYECPACGYDFPILEALPGGASLDDALDARRRTRRE